MKKIINTEIDHCFECPYCYNSDNNSSCLNPKTYNKKVCDVNEKTNENNYKTLHLENFPIWCILEDKKIL